ncbi:MAG: exodeoxyribonuclease VII small subunit [Acidobacteria bacterium]|nr:exodeoxyribonuclease VII small subunit [Acidobacteriota bacterium]
MAETKKAGKTKSGNDDSVESLGYAEAVSELEEILDGLESDTVDVDVLADRVKRAAALIRHCRSKIGDARLHVEQVVGEIDAKG